MYALCAVKTVLRALGLGVNRDELEETVRRGGESEPGAWQIVEEVSVVLHGMSAAISLLLMNIYI